MDSDTALDRALAEKYLSVRDEPAFFALYRRHTPALFGFAMRLAGGDRRDAEDLVQEAWVRAALGLASFRWHSSLRTWLSGIVVNAWRERLRMRRRELFLEVTSEESGSFAPISLRADIEPMDVGRAIADLPDGFRAVLLLHDVEGFTHEEIARMLEIEPGTSKSQLVRARRSMRRRLGAAGEAQGERNERIV